MTLSSSFGLCSLFIATEVSNIDNKMVSFNQTLIR